MYALMYAGLHDLACCTCGRCPQLWHPKKSDREVLLAPGRMAAEEVVLLFLTARLALHASAEQRAAFDLPSRSLRRALCSGALIACGLAAPQPQALVLQRCR